MTFPAESMIRGWLSVHTEQWGIEFDVDEETRCFMDFLQKLDLKVVPRVADQ